MKANLRCLQLVYKVKLDFVLEQLASASVGGYGQDVWSELVDEATVNLTKITVSAPVWERSRQVGFTPPRLSCRMGSTWWTTASRPPGRPSALQRRC